MKTLLALLLAISFAIACDPDRLSFSEAKDSFDLIFTGEVIATKKIMKEIGPSLITTFQIETVWKGSDNLKKINIETSLWGCSQTRFTVTDRHLIFANKRGDIWRTSGHDQHNSRLLKYKPTETLELMALSDWYNGTSYLSGNQFTSVEIKHLVNGLVTEDEQKEFYQWQKTLPKDSVKALVEQKEKERIKLLEYPNNGETLFVLNDTLMTRREYFFKRRGNSRFRLYQIPKDFVEEMELGSDRVIVAHSSYNFYSSPKAVPLLSPEELKLFLLDRISEFHTQK